MSVLRKTKRRFESYSNQKSNKKRSWRIFFLILGLLSMVAFSFLAYLYATGSSIFENGITASNIFKTIRGREILKGEAEGRTNILFLGMGGANHPGGMLSDSIIVLSINTKEDKAAMLSIPRDLLVPIPNNGENKINSSFATGYNNYISKNCKKKKIEACRSDGIEAGANLSSQTVSNVLNIPIHYYVTIDFNGFEKIIDHLGGIDLNVEKAIYDPLFPDKSMKGYEPFKIKAGQQHMNGATALKYSRSRETTSDFDRARRQQRVIEAVKTKATKIGLIANPQKLIDIVSTLGNSVKTNLSISEIKSIVELSKDISHQNIVSKVLSTDPEGLLVNYNNGAYYLKPKSGNFKEIQNMVNNIFDQTANVDPARIEVLNGSKIPNIAAKLANTLIDHNYKITNIANAKTPASTTVIYDYSEGKQQPTVDFIKKGLNAKVITKNRSSDLTVDISIVLGDDYSGFNQ